MNLIHIDLLKAILTAIFFIFLVDLFEEIRPTKQVSILPVGLVGGVLAEKPQIKGQINCIFSAV